MNKQNLYEKELKDKIIVLAKDGSKKIYTEKEWKEELGIEETHTYKELMNLLYKGDTKDIKDREIKLKFDELEKVYLDRRKSLDYLSKIITIITIISVFLSFISLIDAVKIKLSDNLLLPLFALDGVFSIIGIFKKNNLNEKINNELREIVMLFIQKTK